MTSIIVTIKPTMHKDRDAMSRLMTAMEKKLGLGYMDMARAILSVAETVKANSRNNQPTKLRITSQGHAEVLP